MIDEEDEEQLFDCANCGAWTREDDTLFTNSYSFCCRRCYAAFVGGLS